MIETKKYLKAMDGISDLFRVAHEGANAMREAMPNGTNGTYWISDASGAIDGIAPLEKVHVVAYFEGSVAEVKEKVAKWSNGFNKELDRQLFTPEFTRKEYIKYVQDETYRRQNPDRWLYNPRLEID